MTRQTKQQIAALVGVNARSAGRAEYVLDSIKTQAFNEARHCADLPTIAAMYRSIGTAAQRVQHATGTGRIHGTALLTFRAMKPIQICDLVARLSVRESWAALMDDEATTIIRNAIQGK